jgi:hypothetical protein
MGSLLANLAQHGWGVAGGGGEIDMATCIWSCVCGGVGGGVGMPRVWAVLHRTACRGATKCNGRGKVSG